MKYLIISVVGLSLFSLSFDRQDNVGKKIFDKNCSNCHQPNKTTAIAPSFQNIRNDYGLTWTLKFLRNSRELMNKKDINTLYSYYLFGNHQHTLFPALQATYVIKILDYVDSFSVDTSQFKHRFVSDTEKQKFIDEHIKTDTFKKD